MTIMGGSVPAILTNLEHESLNRPGRNYIRPPLTVSDQKAIFRGGVSGHRGVSFEGPLRQEFYTHPPLPKDPSLLKLVRRANSLRREKIATAIAKRYGECSEVHVFVGKGGRKTVQKVQNYSGSKILRIRAPYYFWYGRVLWAGRAFARVGGRACIEFGPVNPPFSQAAPPHHPKDPSVLKKLRR